MRFFLVFSKGMFLNRNYESPGSFHLGAMPRALFFSTTGGGVQELLLTRKRFLLTLILAPPLPPSKILKGRFVLNGCAVGMISMCRNDGRNYRLTP